MILGLNAFSGKLCWTIKDSQGWQMYTVAAHYRSTILWRTFLGNSWSKIDGLFQRLSHEDNRFLFKCFMGLPQSVLVIISKFCAVTFCGIGCKNYCCATRHGDELEGTDSRRHGEPRYDMSLHLQRYCITYIIVIVVVGWVYRTI